MSEDRQTTSIAPDNSNNSSNNNTYRPRSPDLSAFVTKQQQQQTVRQDVFNPFSSATGFTLNHQSQPRQGSSGALTGLPGSFTPTGHRGSYDANPYFTPKGSVDFGQQTQHGLQGRETFGYDSAGGLTQSPVNLAQRAASGKGIFFPEPQSQPQGQALNQQAFTQAPLVFQPLSSANPQQLHQPEHDMPPGRRRRAQPDSSHDNSTQEYDPELSAARGLCAAKASKKRRSGDSEGEWTVGRAPGEAGPSLGIDIKTKFPVARIKRIMQADEDVGKVAQATPTAISKALELFMITLVTKAAAESKDRSSKRVTAAHLKQAVVKDPTFDFLQEIIDKVADPTEKKGSGQGGSEDADEGVAGPAKRKKGARGRKKAGSDED